MSTRERSLNLPKIMISVKPTYDLFSERKKQDMEFDFSLIKKANLKRKVLEESLK